jgi:16S rRNA (guanine1516-N2)-methyltransferase
MTSVDGSCCGDHRLPVRLYAHPLAMTWVERWRERFELIVVEHPPHDATPNLWASPDHVELRMGDSRGRGAWISGQEMERRSRQGGALRRACGVGPGCGPRILDAMAGWGVDALVLAAAGANVVMVEREPHLHVLQQDLARRAGCHEAASFLGDGFRWLSASVPFDVVYLDPMFPERSKRALPRKRMQYLAGLGAADERPVDHWLACAIAHALDRVVLKRRLRDPVVRTPDWQVRAAPSATTSTVAGVNPPEARRTGTPDRSPSRRP